MRARRESLPLALAIAVVVGIGLAVGLAGRVPPDLAERARTIERSLRCPTCQSTSVADSPAVAARQMRAVVEDRLRAGWSDDDVQAFFVDRYGRWILLDPPRAGIDLVLYLVPPLVLAGGAVVLVRRARRPRAGAAKSRLPAPRATRLPTAVVLAVMVAALVVPIVGATGWRGAGAPATGGVVAAAPTIQQLEAWVAAEPGDAEALGMLGNALLEAGRPADAAQRYRALLELDPGNATALGGLGTLFLGGGRPDAARAMFDRVLAELPDQPDALLYRAVATRNLFGTVDRRVRADLERYLEVADPADPRRSVAIELLQEVDAPASALPYSPSP